MRIKIDIKMEADNPSESIPIEEITSPALLSDIARAYAENQLLFYKDVFKWVRGHLTDHHILQMPRAVQDNTTDGLTAREIASLIKQMQAVLRTKCETLRL